jgi:biopolymer transport protein ExbD
VSIVVVDTLVQRTRRIVKREAQFHCGIDVSALLSVSIVLLFIMMVSGPSHHGLSIDRARTAHSTLMPSAVREDVLQVAISASGEVYFRNRRIRAEELPSEIQEGLRDGAEGKVYFIVDSRARYANVKRVLDEITLVE